MHLSKTENVENCIEIEGWLWFSRKKNAILFSCKATENIEEKLKKQRSNMLSQHFVCQLHFSSIIYHGSAAAFKES